MQKKEGFFSVFFVFLFLSFLLWGLSSVGILNGVRTLLEKITSPLLGAKYSLLRGIPSLLEDPELKKLQENNIVLRSKIVSQKKLEEENSALLDQFRTTTPSSYNLLPVRVIGAPEFLPGFMPSIITLNKGSQDGIKVGFAVVFKDNVVGKITKISTSLSQVSLITNSSLSFTAKTQSGVLGVIKGETDKMIFDNIILSQTLNLSDTILTYGDLGSNGIGFPADLIVGKIISIDKTPSALFQKAEIKSLLDFSKLTNVFVVMP